MSTSFPSGCYTWVGMLPRLFAGKTDIIALSGATQPRPAVAGAAEQPHAGDDGRVGRRRSGASGVLPPHLMRSVLRTVTIGAGFSSAEE